MMTHLFSGGWIQRPAIRFGFMAAEVLMVFVIVVVLLMRPSLLKRQHSLERQVRNLTDALEVEQQQEVFHVKKLETLGKQIGAQEATFRLERASLEEDRAQAETARSTAETERQKALELVQERENETEHLRGQLSEAAKQAGKLETQKSSLQEALKVANSATDEMSRAVSDQNRQHEEQLRQLRDQHEQSKVEHEHQIQAQRNTSNHQKALTETLEVGNISERDEDGAAAVLQPMIDRKGLFDLEYGHRLREGFDGEIASSPIVRVVAGAESWVLVRQSGGASVLDANMVARQDLEEIRGAEWGGFLTDQRFVAHTRENLLMCLTLDGESKMQHFDADGTISAAAINLVEQSVVIARDGDAPELVVIDANGQALRQWPVQGLPRELAVAPDGSQIAAAVQNSVLIFTSAGEIKQSIDVAGPARRLAFSPDGSLLAVAGMSPRVLVLEMASESRFPIDHPSRAVALAWSKEGYLATATENGVIRVFEFRDGKAHHLESLRGHRGALSDLAFDSSGQVLVSAGADGAKTWQRPGRGLHSTFPLEGQPTALDYDSAEGYAVLGGGDGKVRYVDPTTGEVKRTVVVAEGKAITAISVRARGPVAVAVDSTMYVYDQGSSEPQKLVAANATPVARMTWINEETLAARHQNGDVLVWKTKARECRRVFKAESPLVAFASDGRGVLGWGDEQGRVWLYQLGDERPREFVRVEGAVSSVAFSPDGVLLAVGTEKSLLDVFDRNGQRMARFYETDDQIASLAFFPDSRLLASGRADGSVQLLRVDLARRSLLLRPRHVKGLTVSQVVVSQNGRTVLALAKGGISVWRCDRAGGLLTSQKPAPEHVLGQTPQRIPQESPTSAPAEDQLKARSE
jgi:WD40 repeat protein